jgi:hypothetical protein
MRSWATVRSCAEPGSTCGHPTAEIRPVPWLFGCCRRVRRLSWNTTGRSDVLAEPAQPPHRSSKAGQRPAVLASTTRRPSACSRRLKYWASSHGIAVWTLTAEGFNVEELLDRLLEVAGGRPMLVERAAALVAAGKEEGQTLTVVADELPPCSRGCGCRGVGVTAGNELVKVDVDADGKYRLEPLLVGSCRQRVP